MTTNHFLQRFSYVVIGVLILFFFAYLLVRVDGPGFPEGGVTVKLFYYNPALDQGPGGVQCSEKGLVAVERIVPPGKNLLEETLRLLIDGRLSGEEKESGITTEFPLNEFTLMSADIYEGTAIITFLDPLNIASGGACRVSVLRAQVEATAKQFPGVDTVRIEPNTLFQP